MIASDFVDIYILLQLNLSSRGTSVAVPLSPLSKREVLKTPYIQIWCSCGYISTPH